MSFIQLDPKFNKNYKAGQVYFTHHLLNPIAMGISWYSREDNERESDLPVSHCGICVGDGIGIESKFPGGVQEYQLYRYFTDPFTRIFFKEPKMLYLHGPYFLSLCWDAIDSYHYDWCILIGHFLVGSFLGRMVLTESMKQRVLKIFDVKDRFDCSEFVLNRSILGNLTDDFVKYITPRQLFNHSMFKTWK